MKPGESPERKMKQMNSEAKQILTGHVSPETAYLVDDYPCGFRLRCKIRYWLEFVPRRGVRLWSQTTNPKRPGEVWNKPKASTFCRFGGCMYLNGEGHVTWTGLHEYMDHEAVSPWVAQFGPGVPEACKPVMELWAKKVAEYEAARAAGKITCTVTTTTPEGTTTETRNLRDEPAAKPEAAQTAEAMAQTLWAQMTDNDKTAVRFGMTPKDAADKAEASGFSLREIALALMDVARVNGGMRA